MNRSGPSDDELRQAMISYEVATTRAQRINTLKRLMTLVTKCVQRNIYFEVRDAVKLSRRGQVDADDLQQDAWLHVLRKAKEMACTGAFRKVRKIGPYLRKMAKRAVRDAAKKGAEKKNGPQTPGRSNRPHTNEPIADESLPPVDTTRKIRQELDAAFRAIRNLGNQKIARLLKCWYRCDHRMMSHCFDKSPGAVRTSLTRAREQIPAELRADLDRFRQLVRSVVTDRQLTPFLSLVEKHYPRCPDRRSGGRKPGRVKRGGTASRLAHATHDH